MGAGCSQQRQPSPAAKLADAGQGPTSVPAADRGGAWETPKALGQAASFESESVQDFVAESSSPDDTPRWTRPPDSEEAALARSPSFHVTRNLENRWFDSSLHEERRGTPSPSPTEPANLQTYVEMNTPQRHTLTKPNAASSNADALTGGSPGQLHHTRAQPAWIGDEVLDPVRPLTPTAGGGDAGPREPREGTPVPFGWEGNDDGAIISLVDADLSLSPIEMQSSLHQVAEPSFDFSKLDTSEHSKSAETHNAFVPISITSAVPEFAVPAYAPPSPPKVVSLGALKKVV